MQKTTWKTGISALSAIFIGVAAVPFLSAASFTDLGNNLRPYDVNSAGEVVGLRYVPGSFINTTPFLFSGGTFNYLITSSYY